MVLHPWQAAAAFAWLVLQTGLAQDEPVGGTSSDPGVVAYPSPEAIAAGASMRLAPGLRLGVFASEPLIANPVSIAFDKRGRCYVVETHRRRTSVFDIGSFPDWLDQDFSFRTVEDRAAFLRREVHPDNPSIPKRFRRDRNGDGRFDWHDLEVESERIRVLYDRDHDGVAEGVKTFASDFKTLVSGVAAGVLARGGKVWFTCIPDLWLLRDTDDDGQADERESLYSGFGVHIAMGGHDLHGLILGPDGKLYFSIADRGSHVEKGGQVRVDLPDTGAVFRCDQDGSNLEVFASGLRNPQELAFDAYGNLWTVDNNGDGGDQARLVYLVEGGESGWRIGWQWLPGMGAWRSERLWQVAPENTAAYLLPPIAYVGHGPAGFAYYPGTGLPDRFRGVFFLADFPGGVRYFKVQPNGASFVVKDPGSALLDNSSDNMRGKLVWGLSPVDVAFGPGGGVYVADWIRGWEKTGKGRIFRISDPASDRLPLTRQTESLLKGDLDNYSVKELGDLLEYPDMRVRLEAEFELVARYQPGRSTVRDVIGGALGLTPLSVLKRIAYEGENLVARLHALWGLGQVIRSNRNVARDLLPLLRDPHPEIRAQTARILCDEGVAGYHADYLRLLRDAEPRVQFFGVKWLGKTVKNGFEEVQEEKNTGRFVSLKDLTPILDLLRRNHDRDLYLRHAAVMALTWIHNLPGLLEAVEDRSPAVRLGVLLALRRLGRPEVSIFLRDPDPRIVLEAARAIYDLPIQGAQLQLAELVKTPTYSVPVLRRAIHAQFRLGQTENAAYLVSFALNQTAPEVLRVEAIEALTQWPTPPPRDRVLGLWRPLPKRDPRSVLVPLRPSLPELLGDSSAAIRRAAIEAIAGLRIDGQGARLVKMLRDPNESVPVREAALRTLTALEDPRWTDALRSARESTAARLREAAAELQSRLPAEDALRLFLLDLDQGSPRIRQRALHGISQLKAEVAGPVISKWLDRVRRHDVPRELILDVLEAARRVPTDELKRHLTEFETKRASKDPLAAYQETLYGGDPTRGRRLFLERQDAGCLRCHRIAGAGGVVGPDLSRIGARASREQILESIVAPNRQITKGFETIVLTLKDGDRWSGTIAQETEDAVVLHTPEDETMTVEKSKIASRKLGPSTMPEGLAELFSRSDLRDLVEFLAQQKAGTEHP